MEIAGEKSHGDKRDTYSSEGTTTTEEPVVYADELSFGLSTAGGVLGGAVGGYLDTTGTATVKLIKSLENLGLLAVGQLDTFLDQQEERQKKKQEQKDEQIYFLLEKFGLGNIKIEKDM
ncbi:hypothetical protein Anas_01666 [Armadillidium nasatum]|uniref:Uncharacterized protein n=1 Tax=Armadillidium nasatum TaxID=96803 RepID=A0A5N5TAG7_9CRUS|nr:hypothetical protein Anas_01666 [Armadillidium nasatum]